MQNNIGRIGLVLVAAAASCWAQAPSKDAPANSAPKLERFDATLLDKSKDPCVDFYQYACSKWNSSHPIPSDMPSMGTSHPLYLWNQSILRETMERDAALPSPKGTEQQVGDYWKSCMNTTGRAANGKQWLATALSDVDALKSKQDLAKVLATLHMKYFSAWEGSDNQTFAPLFGFGPTQDLVDSSKMVAGVDQGGLGLPSRDYYVNNDERSQKLRTAYKQYLVKAFQAAGDTPEQAAKESEATFAIENDLAKAQMDTVSRRDPEKIYHKQTRDQVKTAFPSFDFDTYDKLMGAPNPPFYIVTTLEFLPEIEKQIKTRSLDDLRSYLRAWVIGASARYTTPQLEQERFAFYGTALSGTPQMLPEWRRCVASADAKLGEALGQEYVKVAFPPESKAKAVELMQGIRTALTQDITDVSWMAPETKKQAEAKLDAMIQKIGYPDKWRDYSSVKIVPDNYLANVVEANQFETKRQLAKINKPVDKLEWSMTPPTINAYNDPQNNTINFPAGILQLPFFDAKQDDAANYGSIGMVIGHEIIHGFDDQGRKFDAQGNLRDWWTAADGKAYDERGNCIANQYTHDVPELGVKTNGRLTQGEDTADNGGIHLAMMALENLYKSRGKSLDAPEADGLTARQRFYAAYAFSWCRNERPDAERLQITTNPHSLANYRVNFPLSNQPDFAKAFSCKKGQPMVHENACNVW